MFFNDHDPPHFHAIYGEDEALLEIDTLRVFRGDLPPTAIRLVLEWATLHQDELRYDWQEARAGRPLRSIAPLE